MKEDGTFKIKFKGQTLRVRPLKEGEVITEMCLTKWHSNDDASWQPSMCVGESISGHKNWDYVEVVSKFWKGLSIRGEISQAFRVRDDEGVSQDGKGQS